MDSVLADISTKWYGLANKEYGCNVTIDDVTDWDTSKFFPCGKSIFKYLSQPGFFRDLSTISGAVEGIQAIHDAGHEVFVVTASTAQGATDKMHWMKENFPSIPHENIIITHTKHLVCGDVFIDDSPHNIKAYREYWPRAFIVGVNYPYNRESGRYANRMVDTWDEITKAVLTMEW